MALARDLATHAPCPERNAPDMICPPPPRAVLALHPMPTSARIGGRLLFGSPLRQRDDRSGHPVLARRLAAAAAAARAAHAQGDSAERGLTHDDRPVDGRCGA